MLTAVQTLLAQTEQFTKRDACLTLHGTYVPTDALRDKASARARPFTVAFDVVSLLHAVPYCVDQWGHTEHEKACLTFLSDTLLRHAEAYMQLMGGLAATQGGGESAVTGSHRANFVVWGALSLFKGFLEENLSQSGDALSQMPHRLEALRVWFEAARDAHRHHAAANVTTRPVFDLIADDSVMADAYRVYSGVAGETADAMAASDVVFADWFRTVADPLLQSCVCESFEENTTLATPMCVPACLHTLSPVAMGAWLSAKTSTTALTPALTMAAQSLASIFDTNENGTVLGQSTNAYVPPPREALLRSLSYAFDALQVVPTLGAESSSAGDTSFVGQLGGFWHPTRRVAATSRGVRGARYEQRHPFRWFVDLPGLSMAATVVQSADVWRPAPTTMTTAAADADGGTHAASPDLATTTSTLVFAPPLVKWEQSLRRRMWLDEATLESYRVSADTDNGLCAHLPTGALQPVALLLLFSMLPPSRRAAPHDDDESDDGMLSLSDLHDFLCASLRVSAADNTAPSPPSVVVIVVQADVDKHTMQEVEGWSLPTPSLRLVVVSAVGEWTMTQLCVRFEVLPNSPYTCPAASLRCVWDAAGVFVALLDCCQKPEAVPSRYAVTEQWARYMVVIGSLLDDTTTVDNEATGTMLPITTPSTTAAAATRSMRPPTSSDDSDASETLSTHEDGATEESITASATTAQHSRPPLPSLPLCGSVKRSVWLGGSTELAQREAAHYFELFRRRRVRERVLPTDARRRVPATSDNNAEIRLLAALDERAGVSAAMTENAANDNVSLLKRRLEHHLGHVLHTLLLDEFSASGDGPHEAWARLTRCTACQPAETSPHMMTTTTTELLLDLRCAYWTLLQCAAELCRTVIVEGDEALSAGCVCHALS